MNFTKLFIAMCLVSPIVNAQYMGRFPLEVQNGGKLPTDSIIFIGGNNGGENGGETPVDPEEPETANCEYDPNAGTAYVEQQMDDGSIYIMQLYNNQNISNGSKGGMQFEYIPPDYGPNAGAYTTRYFEICLNGNDPIPKGPEPVWADNTCRYDFISANQYHWWVREAPEGYSSSYQIIRYYIGISGGESLDSNINYPAGTVYTGSGYILPESEQRFTVGNIQYSRGALRYTRIRDGYPTDYLYEICKTTL
jgi:hypothetical protein